ncbi:MAG TPA: ABC transporter ATP-binding protein [Bryobacteraceae bacterium]|nr:ABC transporter ATP-binding protein [Bryobacteraceae bacterium]
MPIIDLKNVSKIFSRQIERKLLRQKVADMFRRRPENERFHALRDVSFSVEEGESVALIGANGAGKSTALCVVAGLAKPTTGTVTVMGRVAALLELGSGFHPDLTGEENIFVNAALLGYSEPATKERFSEIVEFAGLGQFIEERTRSYSSGMMVRLAFSIAVHVDPQILIVDEVLAVGDAQFQQKCLRKVEELRRKRVTMLCVSHSPQMVSSFCDRAIWLHNGEVVTDGSASEVTAAYTQFSVDNILPSYGSSSGLSKIVAAR